MITLGPLSIDLRFRPRPPRVPPARPNPAIVRESSPDHRYLIHLLRKEIAVMSALSDKIAALNASLASLEARTKALVDAGVATPDDLAALDAAAARIDAIDPLPAPAAPAAPAPDAPAPAPAPGN